MVWCAIWIPPFGPWCHFPRSPGVLSAASSWLRLSQELPWPRKLASPKVTCLPQGQLPSNVWTEVIQSPASLPQYGRPAPDLPVGSSETPVATPSHTTSLLPNPPPPTPLRAWLSRTLTNEPSPCKLIFLTLFLRELSLRLTYISYGLHSTFCSRWAIERGGAKDDYTVMAPGRSLGGSLYKLTKQVCSERVSKASQLLTVNSLYGVWIKELALKSQLKLKDRCTDFLDFGTHGVHCPVRLRMFCSGKNLWSVV